MNPIFFDSSPEEKIYWEAFHLAAEAHRGQVDKAGELYFYHVARVSVSLLPDFTLATIGVLHDVLEDTTVHINRICGRSGITESTEIRDALIALYRQPGMPYEEYIQNLKTNPQNSVSLARKVKLADLADNLRPERLAKAILNGHDMNPLIDRYRWATEILEKELS